MDSGYDETHNPFADVSEEYTKKKEENLKKKSVKRMSAQQRQYNKVRSSFVVLFWNCIDFDEYLSDNNNKHSSLLGQWHVGDKPYAD